MRHSAWHMAECANQLWENGTRWHANFCTDMLNLAEFKGLVRQEIARLPTVVYFHENQLSYPNKVPKNRDLHFGITNFSSALAADSIWFNSQFNRDSLFMEIQNLCQQWPDYKPTIQLGQIKSKSEIVSPGIEPASNERGTEPSGSALHLLWAARWEHDKGPDDLLELLNSLRHQKIDFRISVIGQSFRKIPKAFEEIQSQFASQIIEWGFQESRESYWKALASADVFLSTAHHEFFGLAACEAISAGLFPILPNRLAYPELLNLNGNESSCFLYDTLSEAIQLIQNVPANWKPFCDLNLAKQFRKRFGGSTQAAVMDEKLSALI